LLAYHLATKLDSLWNKLFHVQKVTKEEWVA